MSDTRLTDEELATLEASVRTAASAIPWPWWDEGGRIRSGGHVLIQAALPDVVRQHIASAHPGTLLALVAEVREHRALVAGAATSVEWDAQKLCRALDAEGLPFTAGYTTELKVALSRLKLLALRAQKAEAERDAAESALALEKQQAAAFRAAVEAHATRMEASALKSAALARAVSLWQADYEKPGVVPEVESLVDWLLKRTDSAENAMRRLRQQDNDRRAAVREAKALPNGKGAEAASRLEEVAVGSVDFLTCPWCQMNGHPATSPRSVWDKDERGLLCPHVGHLVTLKAPALRPAEDDALTCPFCVGLGRYPDTAPRSQWTARPDGLACPWAGHVCTVGLHLPEPEPQSVDMKSLVRELVAMPEGVRTQVLTAMGAAVETHQRGVALESRRDEPVLENHAPLSDFLERCSGTPIHDDELLDEAALTEGEVGEAARAVKAARKLFDVVLKRAGWEPG